MSNQAFLLGRADLGDNIQDINGKAGVARLNLIEIFVYNHFHSSIS